MNLRRLTSLLVLWLALFSVAAPAVACGAAAVQRGPCCPEEGTPPCGECPASPQAGHSAAVHCTTAPAVATRSLTTDSVTRLSPLDVDPVVSTPAPADASDPADEPPPADEPRLPDELSSPTWLLTGRLRL